MKVFNGNHQTDNLKIGIVVARFNDFVTEKLLKGATSTLKLNGISDENIEVAWVPGAFEIPLIAQSMAETGKYDGLIALGAVIRGETSHYDYVCNETANGILSVGLKSEIPTMFGILTTDTIEQAMNRAGFKSGNKGSDCATSVIEMINLKKQLKLTNQ